MENTQRIILHIDMNSYFASVEQQANPLLRGKPVGVCEHLGGIIIAPSVEAKRLGIALGTPVWEAVKKCADIVLLPTDPDKYRTVTDRFMRILCDYTDTVERYSIDEAFIDISKYCNNDWKDAFILGFEIKQRLYHEIGEWVSCSVGIGPKKLVAKIAADLGEGDIDRIYVVRPNETEVLYDRLELTDVPGIGSRLERALHRLSITTLRQLRDYPVENLINHFGVNGYMLHRIAQFDDQSPVVIPEEEPIQSVGHMYTLPRQIDDEKKIKELMLKLSEKIGRRMRQAGAWGSTVHYFHSDKAYHRFSRQRSVHHELYDGRDIYEEALGIFTESLKIGEQKIKIMGVAVSNLHFDDLPEPLFKQYKRPRFLVQAMDQVNNKYGEFTLRRARIADTEAVWAKDTVGFGRIRA